MSPDDPANTAAFPDGLNRTQLQLKEELKDFLDIENAEIQGVSKDIQLVSVVGSLTDPILIERNFDFVNQKSGNFSLPMGSKKYVTIQQILFKGFNETGSVEALDFYVRGTQGFGTPTADNIQLFDNNGDSFPASQTLSSINQPTATGQVWRLTMSTNSASNPFREVLNGWLMNIPVWTFNTLYLRYEHSGVASANIQGNFKVLLEYHNDPKKLQ